MATQDVAIVTDSAAALSVAAQSAYRVTVVPLRITIGGQEFLEGVNISPPRIVAALMSGETVTVREPTAEDMAVAYARLADEGVRGIVSVHLSHRMHDAAGSAREAATSSRVPVRVMDSGTVAMAQGFVALAAAAVALHGRDLHAVETAAAATMVGSRLMFTVATMDYLHKDGRVPRVVKSLSNVTGMRPLLLVVDGKVTMVERVRGTEAARARVHEEMEEYRASLRRPASAVALVGGGSEDGLQIEGPGAVAGATAGASLTAHAGPGTYVVAVAPMPDEYAI